ncbi:hypothetical protein Landi51_00476 [Colletotrichum acutatum]
MPFHLCLSTSQTSPANITPQRSTTTPSVNGLSPEAPYSFLDAAIDHERLHSPAPSIGHWGHGLELMHHFTLVTANSLSVRPDMQHVWRVTMPEIGYDCPFVMHGILTIAALHKAYLIPSARDKYLELATSHQTAGLEGFRTQLHTVNDTNWKPFFCFASLVVFYVASLPVRMGQDLDSEPDIMGVFIFVRGIRAILEPYQTKIVRTEFAPMATGIWTIDPSDPSYKLPPLHNSPLPPDVFEAIQGLSDFYTENLHDSAREEYVTAVRELEKAVYLMAHAGANLEVGMILFWPYVISENIMADIHALNPYSLSEVLVRLPGVSRYDPPAEVCGSSGRNGLEELIHLLIGLKGYVEHPIIDIGVPAGDYIIDSGHFAGVLAIGSEWLYEPPDIWFGLVKLHFLEPPGTDLNIGHITELQLVVIMRGVTTRVLLDLINDILPVILRAVYRVDKMDPLSVAGLTIAVLDQLWKIGDRTAELVSNYREFDTPELKFGIKTYGGRSLFDQFDIDVQSQILGFLGRASDVLEQAYRLLDRPQKSDIKDKELQSSATPKFLAPSSPAPSNVSLNSTELALKRPRSFRKVKWSLMDKKRVGAIVQDYSELNGRIHESIKLGCLGTSIGVNLQHLNRLETDDNSRALGFDVDARLQMATSLTQPTAQSLEINDPSLRRTVELAKTFGDKFSICEWEGRPCLVEYRSYSPDSPVTEELDDQTRDLVDRLANLLHQPKEIAFRTPKCQGWVSQMQHNRVAYMFSIPEVTKPSPTSLLDILSRTSPPPSLSKRFSLAHKLSRYISQLHLVKWVHESFRSEKYSLLPSKGLGRDECVFGEKAGYLGAMVAWYRVQSPRTILLTWACRRVLVTGHLQAS